jgi:hypothetical protein
MQRLVLRTLTLTIGYSLLGQGLRILYPFFSAKILLVSCLAAALTLTFAYFSWSKYDRVEFYITAFWVVIGLIVGIAK